MAEIPVEQGEAALTTEMGEGEKGVESEGNFTRIQLECRGPGVCDSSCGGQTFRTGAEADGGPLGVARGPVNGFSRRGLWAGMEARRVGRSA